MEVVKPVIAQTENNSATLKTTDGQQVAIPGKIPKNPRIDFKIDKNPRFYDKIAAMVSRSVMMVLAVELLKLAVIRKSNSVKWIPVNVLIALVHIE